VVYAVAAGRSRRLTVPAFGQLVLARDCRFAASAMDAFLARAKGRKRSGCTRKGELRRTEWDDNRHVKLKLDLHDIYNRGDEIERALRSIIDEAVAKKAPLVEIIPGKGSGQLKKRVLRFLDRKDVKALYHRVEKDRDNFGRVFVHFRWK
jgi:DNA-nicking Smr family endonuclease